MAVDNLTKNLSSILLLKIFGSIIKQPVSRSFIIELINLLNLPDVVSSKFFGATLIEANFQNANLIEADFSSANITNANFDGANLNNATWTDGNKCGQGSIGVCNK